MATPGGQHQISLGGVCNMRAAASGLSETKTEPDLICIFTVLGTSNNRTYN